MTNANQTPLPQHVQELKRSGITLETATAAGIYTETRHDRITALLGWRVPRKLAPALVFPFRTTDGDNGYARIKPDVPRVQQGKAVKYESPTGRPNQIYIPPGTFAVLNDADHGLLITEGEKKSLRADQDGLRCIGLVGVWGWKESRAERLLPQIEQIEWKGRRVFIVFDSDIADNSSVQDAESRFAQQLKHHGAIVKVVRLPGGPDGEKVGLDDFLMVHQVDELHKLIAEADDPAPIDPAVTRIKAAKLDTYPTAIEFLKQVAHKDGIDTLKFWRDEFWAWDGERYQQIPEPELQSRLVRYLEPAVSHITRTVIGNVMTCLKATTLLSSQITMPAWLGSERPFPADEVLATASGLVHLPSITSGQLSLTPPTPQFFSANTLDYQFDTAATCPEWQAFLRSLWPEDQECRDTLQEWFGYMLLPDTKQHKVLMIVGPKRSGKGTIGRVLVNLVGRHNVCSPTLVSLSTSFGLSPVLDKMVAVTADARLSGRADGVAVVERLLSISGEDPQDVNRKNLPILAGVRLPVRFTILTNELPHLRDVSGAFVSRVVLLPLVHSWLGREDHSLGEKLYAERSGILTWAPVGWQRLTERGRFIQPSASQEQIDDLENLSSPVIQFLADCCKE